MKDYTREQLNELKCEKLLELARVRIQHNSELEHKAKRAGERIARITQELEAEEELLTNKLMKNLGETEKEKEALVKRLKEEEENIQHNLKKQLQKVAAEKVELHNQLECEQEYITHKLAKQLRQAISSKDALMRRIEAEKRAKEELQLKIQEADRQLKNVIQIKLEKITCERQMIQAEREQEVNLAIGKFTKILEKLTTERKSLEEKLSEEVKKKQDLVLALSNEMQNLSSALQKKVKQIRKDKSKIRQQLQSTHFERDSSISDQSDKSSAEESKLSLHSKSFRNANQFTISSSEEKCKWTSQNIYATPTRSSGRREPSQMISDPRLQLFQRDKEIYESQSKKIINRILFLTINLEEANKQASKYKRLVEDLTFNRLPKSEIAELATKIERKGSEVLLLVDNSMESHTESFVSSDLAHRERSVSLNAEPGEIGIGKKYSTGLGTPRPEEKQKI